MEKAHISFSCGHGGRVSVTGEAEADTLAGPKYASGYEVKDSIGVRLVNVGENYHFALVANDDVAVGKSLSAL